jgi:hypothetical protein
MGRKFLVAALALATAVVPLTVAAAAPAEPRVQAEQRAARGTQLQLTFDNGERLQPGTVVRDSSGRRHHGRVVVQDGGTLRRVPGLVRRGAGFPGVCRGCGRAIVEVRDRRGLDPGRAAFVFGAAIKVSPRAGARGANLVQKGYFKQRGGQYKLQLTAAGTPSCVVYGSGGRITVTATRDVTNGRWHRLSCTRAQGRVTLRIDGRVRSSETGATGRIQNTASVRVGGKKINPANEQFHGHLDSVYVRRLPAR